MDPVPPKATFLGAPPATDLTRLEARYAFLGIPRGVPYEHQESAATIPSAADAVRTASMVYRDSARHHDFDLDGPAFPHGLEGVLTDVGDATHDPVTASSSPVTDVVRAVVAAGAVPLAVGVDHSIPPLVVRGLAAEPLDVLHVDAHLDYRDEVHGVRNGYSSPIRRLRDLPHVRRIVQVGLRDIGSARPEEVVAARAAGNVLVTAEQVHEAGVAPLIDLFDPDTRLYITIDVDGLDPSCAPGTRWPAPGGLFFWQAAKLVRNLCARCRLAGMDVCEFLPAADPQGHTALAITRLLMLAVSAGR